MKAKPTSTPGAVVLEVTSEDEKLLAMGGRQPAFKINEILVPIDFSECSKKALRYAAALAREHEASITLIHVVTTPVPLGEPSAMDYLDSISEMRAEAQRKLQTLAGTEVGRNVIAKSRVSAGSPPREIVELAASLPADLIVISTHGRTGLKHVLLGSVTEYLVRHAPCPVLVVRQREHECLATV